MKNLIVYEWFVVTLSVPSSFFVVVVVTVSTKAKYWFKTSLYPISLIVWFVSKPLKVTASISLVCKSKDWIIPLFETINILLL